MSGDDWIANSAASWATAVDWDSGVPTSASDVYIGNNSKTATVTSSSDVVINTLQIRNGDALDITNVSTFIVINGIPNGMFGFIDVDSSNFQVDNGTINNSATIELQPTQNINTDLTIYNTVELNGAGSIIFAGDGDGAIIGGQAHSALTNADNNISGEGMISGLFFTNQGTVETNNALGAFTLKIAGSANGGGFDNEGFVYADNGGTLVLGYAPGTAPATIVNNNTIGVRSSGAFATIEIANSVTIKGNGQILLEGSSPANDRIISDGKSASLTLDGVSLSGGGTLGDANLTLTIDSNAQVGAIANQLVVNTGANTINNAGDMSAAGLSGGGFLDIQSAVHNTGLVIAADGAVIDFDAAGTTNTGIISADGGTITFFKSVTNNGGIVGASNDGTMILHSSILGLNNSQIEIGNNGLLDLSTGGTVSQGVTFAGIGAVLELDQNAGQIGTNISGAQGGDSVDLTFLTFASGDHAVWTQSGTEGTVSVVAGNGSTLATVVFAGSWNTQDFGLTADSTGGTEITVVSPIQPEAPENHTFPASGSQKIFNGDGGHDTVMFDGPRAEYSLRVNGDGSLTAVDNGPAGDGTSQLLAIQYLQFTDQTVFAENADNANIARLYSAAFNRVPDAAGLNFWEDIYSNNISAAVKSSGYYIALAQTNDGSGVTIADGFIQSGEFQHLYGTLNDGQFITQMYENVLGRAPDTAGYNFWLGQMQAGTTQAMVLVGFAESPENTAKSGSWLITT
jgi:hypothetical protein